MNKLKLATYLMWSLINGMGLLLGAVAWKISGDGIGLMFWCAVWQLYVFHKIIQLLEEV